MSRRAFWRILDANHNRAREALRVCEDILRFVLNHKKLSFRSKVLRHRLARILSSLPVPYAKIVDAREIRKDVGRDRMFPHRKGAKMADIFLANIKRAEEAVRVLEEVSRVLFPKRAPYFERLRFSIYELEKEAVGKL